jgi:hypothetical protein
MARRVMLPSTAAGSSWSPASAALVADGSFSSLPPGSGASAPLVLGAFIDSRLPLGDTVAGIEVVAKVGYQPEAAPDGIDRSGMGWCWRGMGGGIPNWGPGLTRDTSVFDGDQDTFWWAETDALFWGVAAFHDLLAAKSVSAAKIVYSSQSAGVPALHSSSDGLNWTHVTWSPGGGPSGYPGGQAIRSEWVGFTAVTARYWRLSAVLSQSFKIREFLLYGGASGGGGSGPGGPGYPEEGMG